MSNSLQEKKITTAKEFISNFQNVSVSLDNLVISDDVTLISHIYKVEKLFLKDIQFKGKLFFDGCDLKDGIKFINCEFENFLVFQRCLTNKSDYKFLPGDKSVEFVNCKINFHLDIRNCKLEGGVVFNNCILEKAYIEQLVVSFGGGIEFRNKTVVNKSIHVSNCNFLKGNISHNESIFNGGLRYENNAVGSYEFSFSNFSSNIFIWAGYCLSILFYESQFDDDFNLQIVKVKRDISINDCVFKKIFRIELDDEKESIKGYLNSIYISQSDFLNGFRLKQFTSNLLIINKIDLIFQNLNGSFHFDDILIEELHMSGYNTSSRVVLENVILKKLDLEKFRNSGSIDFIKVRPDETDNWIKIKSSILGSFAFVNCQLKNYKEIIIQDSVFDQVISSGTKWFDFKQITTRSESSEQNWFKRTYYNVKMLFQNSPENNIEVQNLYQIREIFRQLKVSMDKQGNRIQGLFFQSQEFIAYEKELSLTHCIYKPERLILWSNRSNSHGQDWLKPLFLGVIFTGLWFVSMVISMNNNLELRFPWNSNFLTTYKIYAEYFKGFPDLFNPTFRLDLVFPNHIQKFTFATYCWALVQRISISYFIFQTVSAFRKYMK